MSLTVKIILAIIVIHLIAGFGWLIWKLSPKDGDELIDSSYDHDDQNEIQK